MINTLDPASDNKEFSNRDLLYFILLRSSQVKNGLWRPFTQAFLNSLLGKNGLLFDKH